MAESSTGGVSYYEQDGLGSVTSVSNSSGSIAGTSYDSYGNITSGAQQCIPVSRGVCQSVPNPFLYTGREFDAETNLYFYRARYYDASLGRFSSEDLERFRGGISLYGYVGNSPTRFIDPFGRAPANPQDMASLQSLFPGFRPLGETGLVVPVSCDKARVILEYNGFYSSHNWVTSNPFLFWDPIAHHGGWEFRKKDGMHIRMKYPDRPCNTTCTLDQAHTDLYNPMYDPWGHFTRELVPDVLNTSVFDPMRDTIKELDENNGDLGP